MGLGGMAGAQHHVAPGPHSAGGVAVSVPPGVAAMSSVTKAVQLTATVNSVPVAGPSQFHFLSSIDVTLAPSSSVLQSS